MVVLALQILVRDRVNARRVSDLNPYPVFDPFQVGERLLAFLDVLIFDQQCRLPVKSVRHQRVVSIELVLDRLFLECLFDPQYLLNLVTNRKLVFEQ